MSKRILQGVVVSDKSDKTVVVSVTRRCVHELYKKIVTKRKKYAAHDPSNKFKVGDVVFITEHRPVSKTKKWLVIDQEISKEGI